MGMKKKSQAFMRAWTLQHIFKKIKPFIFVMATLPAFYLVYGAIAGTLGANPIEYIIRDLGEWGLIFLIITLSLRPLRDVTKQSFLMGLRRMLGLFAFFYVCLHMLVYVILDLSGSISALWREIVERQFITVGMLAFLLLIPLAVTSHQKLIKKMGAAKWQRLHRLVYPIGILAVIHYYMMAKADKTEPLIYGFILALLLGYRAVVYVQKTKKRDNMKAV
jgi:sulfoxide reductase heme-binding subunit YedZ